MQAQPILETERLILRPFTLADAARVQALAGDQRIADTTQNIPHPYEDGMAESWLKGRRDLWEKREVVSYAVCIKQTDELIGCVGLRVNRHDNNAALGYWVGYPYWNQGYCTEASKQLLTFAFENLNLHRIHSCYFSRNPGSGKVMQKLGMQYEGEFKQHAFKDGHYEDLIYYGLVRPQ